ncbi:MAG: hypothetical protein GXY48_09430 [Methanomicrobiales archaeon]|nr:hypothetical protein [Methanomicrobiales archaeon]
MKFNTISFGNKVYLYQNGIYVLDKGEIGQEIKYMIDQARQVGINCNALKHPKSEVLENLLSEGLFVEYPFNQYKGLIPVENGVISVDFDNKTVRLIDYEPQFMFTYKLPVIYDPDADDSFIEQVIYDWLGEQGFIVPQIIGQVFLQMQGNVYKKSYLFLGDGNAGKSTCIDLLDSFFGDSLISKVSIGQLVGSPFATSSLEGKALNLSDDASSIQLKQSEKFKELTGTSRHDINRKYCRPYVGIANPVYIMACNKPPSLDRRNIDYQFLDRWIILEFQGVFSVNPRFKHDLFTEKNKSALLNLAISSMISIYHSGLREIERDETNEILWLMRYTPLYREFVSKYMVKDSTGSINKDILYEVYRAVCQQIGWRCWDKPVFYKDLTRFGIESDRISIDGRRVYVIKGWVLNDQAVSDLTDQLL